MEMIPTISGRPPVVTIGSCTIYLSIRDTEYLRQSKHLRAVVIARHPDKHPSASPLAKYNLSRSFRYQMRLYVQWKLAQRREYWLLNLMPPDWRGPLTAPPPRFPHSHKGYVVRRIEA